MQTPGSFARAQWETKLQLRDIAKDKTNNLSVDVLAERNGPMRMEASAVMGIPVASYVMDRSGFRCAVYSSKTFYEGSLNEQALKPLLHLALSPVVLSRVVFDEPLHGSDWKCNAGSDGFVADCESASRKIKIAWHREEASREVHKTEVQFKPETFKLSPAPSFKLIRL